MNLDGSAIAQSLHAAGHALSGETLVCDPSAEPANRCRHGAKPHPCDPNYIHACHEQRWKLATWRKSQPTAISWKPARCYSWRHDGPCRKAKASEDYARIKEALEKQERDLITYAVITLDPSAWTGEGWAKIQKKDGRIEKRPRREGAKEDQAAIGASYRALADRWGQFAKALKREYGNFSYVSTVEQHRSGWPHMNVIFVNEKLAKHVKAEGARLREWGRKSKGREVAKKVFGDLLERAGFGRIAFLEPALARSDDDNGVDRLAAYIAKLAGDPGAAWDGKARGLLSAADDAPAGHVVESIEGRTVAEISKFSQAPTRAPAHFRRLRSSKGFLPPKHRDEDVTGELFDESGRPVASDPVARIRKAAINADTREACENVMRQASALEDRHRERSNATSMGFMAAIAKVDLEIDEDFVCRQSKMAIGLAPILDYLEKKLAGLNPSMDVKTDERVPPGHHIAPADGVTLKSAADVELWIGQVGPGMQHSVKKYKLGNRFFLPQDPT